MKKCIKECHNCKMAKINAGEYVNVYNKRAVTVIYIYHKYHLLYKHSTFVHIQYISYKYILYLLTNLQDLVNQRNYFLRSSSYLTSQWLATKSLIPGSQLWPIDFLTTHPNHVDCTVLPLKSTPTSQNHRWFLSRLGTTWIGMKDQ